MAKKGSAPKVPKANADGSAKERKPRKPPTQSQLDARIVAQGKDEIEAISQRIAKHTEIVSVLQADKEKLVAGLAEARQRLLAE